MTILGLKPFHDGTIAALTDGRLAFSIENEKDSHGRMTALEPETILRIMGRLDAVPEIIALSGWRNCGGGYLGLERGSWRSGRLFGKAVQFFTSSHERSHLFAALGMAPFAPVLPCYALVWEGSIGRFYRIDERGNVTGYPAVLTYPGYRYIYLYYLASRETERLPSMAGKLMALAGWPYDTKETSEEKRLREALLNRQIPPNVERIRSYFPKKEALARIPWIDGGLETPEFRAFARRFSDGLFDAFHRFAQLHLKEQLPLLVGGGCGLNCEWNSRWINSGLFRDVFVPPCVNDSGSAIGAAVEAQFLHTGEFRINWSVDAGEPFIEDVALTGEWEWETLDLTAVARHLNDGGIVPWVQGHYEIGPRALGFRSLLASPRRRETRDLLNRIKQRESFRPIAPVCLEREAGDYFDSGSPSKYMLELRQVISPEIPAVTHDDATARPQTVTASDNLRLHDLLVAFKHTSGVSVLCNTSLNWKGKGFINRLSELLAFAETHQFDVCVVNDRLLCRRPASVRPAARLSSVLAMEQTGPLLERDRD